MLKKILLLGTILFFSFILHAQEKGVQFNKINGSSLIATQVGADHVKC